MLVAAFGPHDHLALLRRRSDGLEVKVCGRPPRTDEPAFADAPASSGSVARAVGVGGSSWATATGTLTWVTGLNRAVRCHKVAVRGARRRVCGSNNCASLFFVLGTANNLAIWAGTSDECMPQMLNGTGAAQWGDVGGHPWTTGMQLDYFIEAALWSTWLKSEHPELTKVAEITYNNDYGQRYRSGFAYNIEGTGIEVVDQELHESAAPNLDNQFTTLAASGAQVLLIETSGAFCTQAMAAVEKQTTWHPLVIMSFTCGSLNQYFQPLIDQGLTGKDRYMMQSFKGSNEPALADDPFIELYYDTLEGQARHVQDGEGRRRRRRTGIEHDGRLNVARPARPSSAVSLTVLARGWRLPAVPAVDRRPGGSPRPSLPPSAADRRGPPSPTR